MTISLRCRTDISFIFVPRSCRSTRPRHGWPPATRYLCPVVVILSIAASQANSSKVKAAPPFYSLQMKAYLHIVSKKKLTIEKGVLHFSKRLGTAYIIVGHVTGYLCIMFLPRGAPMVNFRDF